MVAEDLLVFGDPVGGGAREPLGEPLVQVGALLLRHRLVGGVTDQQVAEPERIFPRELGTIGPDQLLPRQREQA